MSFFKEFKVADENTCKARWAGLPNGTLFYCAFCGKQFKPGDSYKAIYTNDIKGAGGNPLCCWYCYTDGRREGEVGDERMRDLWKKRSEEWDGGYKGKWRWFQDHCHRVTHQANESHWQHEVQRSAREVRDL